MKNSITAMRPISVGNQEVERVRMYKLLGVLISHDLKLNTQVEYVTAKAANRLLLVFTHVINSHVFQRKQKKTFA